MDSSDLTSSQRAAVEHVDGPLLILAGPGSGKTRVVTRRIANLVESGIPPRQILAITFTNKAAGEMQDRIARLLPGTFVWATTFHKFCARLLRQYGAAVGVQSNYSILDTADQRQALREVMREEDIDAGSYPPEKIAYRISSAKNDLITPEAFRDNNAKRNGDHWDAVVAKVYPAYQKWILQANSLDFDDLLLQTALLLTENQELREQLDDRYRYILVDEYQDTNASQYGIVAALSRVHRNLCVTGDPDQSIYGWRGARIENILRFERDFPGAKTVRLEQNFRSTAAILRAADSLIAHNRKRKVKRLITENPEGEPVRVLCFGEARNEADGIAREILQLVDSGAFRWGDVAIIYRVNALSRQLEQAFARYRIPSQLAAGVAFYDRAEIKDLLAYLNLIHNPADRTAFLRAVNKPLRGLGETSQRKLFRWAELQRLTPLEACQRSGEVSQLSARAAKGFRLFYDLLQECSRHATGGIADLLELVISQTGYRRGLVGSPSEKDRDRLANIDEFVAAARQYDETAGDEHSLEGFLETTALVNETDSLDDSAGQVTMMTLHAAKGLEFPVVFIAGVEDGLIPHERSKRDDSGDLHREMEEERRLLFVGMTRAKQRLYLTQCRLRALHGRSSPTIVSPFLHEFLYERVELDDLGDFKSEEWTDDEPTIALRQDEQSVGEDRPEGFPRLMTAADLLNGGNSNIQIPQGFALGMSVRHPRYGLGTVVKLGGFGARRTVSVTFRETEQTLDFVAAKAPLQRVGT